MTEPLSGSLRVRWADMDCNAHRRDTADHDLAADASRFALRNQLYTTAGTLAAGRYRSSRLRCSARR